MQIFYCDIKEGKLKVLPFYQSQLSAYIAANEGKRMVLEVYPYRSKRSNGQNRFYWGPFLDSIIECFMEQGRTIGNNKETKQVIHNTLKDEFGNKYIQEHESVNILTGELTTYTTLSTSNMQTTDFIDYLEDISRFFAENFGWVLPVPDENKVHSKRSNQV